MSDFDLDQLLAGAVDEYREHTLGQIKPAGTAAAQRTATHRKRVRAIALSVLAAALVIAPVSAYAAMDHDHNGPSAVAASHSVAPTTSPTATDTPTKPASPPATGSAAPITEHDLANATITIPTSAWSLGCPHGTVTLTKGRFVWNSPNNVPDAVSYGLQKMVSTDLNHDGVVDAVALFACGEGDPATEIALGFDRTPSGAIHTLGSVVTGIDTIHDITTTSNGSVRVLVAEFRGSDRTAEAAQTPQSRTYRWNGTRFAQTGGSTSFTTSHSGVSAQLSDFTFAKAVNGKRAGTMTVSLHNSGSKSISNASIVYVFGTFTLISPTCPPLLYGPGDFAGRCFVPSIAAGATATITFHFTATSSELSGYGTSPKPAFAEDILVQINVGDQRLWTQPKLGNVVLQ